MTLSEERGSFDHETFLSQYQDLLSSTTPCPFQESNLKDNRSISNENRIASNVITSHTLLGGKLAPVCFRLRTCLLEVISFSFTRKHALANKVNDRI